jgi:hypothetical protein
MGAVPITLRSTLDPLYSQFPVVLLDAWSDLFVPGALERYKREIIAKFGTNPFRTEGEVMQRLSSGYWSGLIKSEAAKIRASSCGAGGKHKKS